MQWLMTSHVRRYHRHYRSSGHIWQGRFKSFVISENDHLLAAIRYVEGNPVRAGMVTSALDWPWSSHRENAGTGSAGMAVPVPLDQEGEQQGEGQAPLEPVPGEAVKKGQAPAEPVPGAVPVVDAGMVKLPSDWTDFVDTPLTLKELSRLGLAPARLPVPAFIDSDSLIGM
jgi:putative transposase